MSRKEIANLRGQVTRSRLELRELRVGQRQRQIKIRHLQAQFWRGLQNQRINDSSLDENTSQLLYDDIQRALDELGPEEANYDEKEDDLDALEYKLGKLEDRFYDTDADFAGSKAGFDSSSSCSSPRRSPSSTPTRSVGETSWKYRYLSRVGDANIVRERLENLCIERSQYIRLEQDRAAMGLDYYPPNVEFLDTFEEVYATNALELREIEEDLERQWLQNESPSTPPTSANLSKTIDLDQVSTSLTDEHARRKIWCQPHTPRRKSDGDLKAVPEEKMTVRQRINKWILESLQVSRIEKVRLKAMLHDPNLSEDSWWSLVRDYWQRDQAAVSPPPSHRRRSKSSRPVSATLHTLSHSAHCVSKPNDTNMDTDIVNSPLNIGGPLPWETVDKFPSKTWEKDLYIDDLSSPDSVHQRDNIFDGEGCEVIPTSARY
ncbi:hypothetical protein MMC07_003759 [Pseudocyphellaria aurata]|nr:hypothetical protein [Pseudocyphellaria aurata]